MTRSSICRFVLALLPLLMGCRQERSGLHADSPPATPGGATVVLSLPGAELNHLLNNRLRNLPPLLHASAGAWAAGWRPGRPLPRWVERVPIPLRRDAARPFGVVTDQIALQREIRRRVMGRVPLWIEPGDTTRAASYAPLCTPPVAREHLWAALQIADRLAAALRRDPRVRGIWIVAPPLTPGPALAPVFRYRRAGGPGLLASGSTHLPGLVTVADLDATLAEAAAQSGLGEGRRVTMIPERDPDGTAAPLGAMRRLRRLAESTERERAVVNRLVQWLLLALIVAGLVAINSGRRLPPAVALAPLALPLLLLIEGAARAGHALVALGIGMLGVAALARRRGRHGLVQPSDRFPVLAGRLAAATAVALGVALLNGDCLRWTVLGQSVLLGARFYGMGNEFMGWWIGATLLAVRLLTPPRRPWMRIVPVLLLALLIGHPGLGANFGGGFTAWAAAAGEAWPMLRRRRSRAVAVALCGAALLLAVALWDAHRSPEAQTHLGRLVQRIAGEGPAALFLMAGRKLVTNLRVTLGLWGVLAGLGAWLAIRVRHQGAEEVTARAAQSLLPVAAAAYLFNDSGVIAAALMLACDLVAVGPEEIEPVRTPPIPTRQHD